MILRLTLGTHFLIQSAICTFEIIPGPKTSTDVIDSMSHFVRRVLEKESSTRRTPRTLLQTGLVFTA